MDFQEIIYSKENGTAKITMNRPHKLNAFTNTTLKEMSKALIDAWADEKVGVIVLTGAGDRAFCVGGDQSIREKGGYKLDEGGSELKDVGELVMGDVHSHVMHLLRNIPKPVIAMVNGYAIGGGHILHLVCDLTVASEKARFGQAGPKVGSFDAGYGTSYLARVVGEKKAREIWYLCEQYSAEEALGMGLVNKVVPHSELQAEVDKMCAQLLEKSPTALAALKVSFNAETDHVWGIQHLAGVALNMYYNTDEALEGRNAFMEKRNPDFGKYR